MGFAATLQRRPQARLGLQRAGAEPGPLREHPAAAAGPWGRALCTVLPGWAGRCPRPLQRPQRWGTGETGDPTGAQMGLTRNLAGCGAALSHLLLLLLHIEALVHSGLGEPDPKINGQSLLVSTMQEDESRDFTCQVDSWQAVPMLTWYLNGKKQETNGSTVLTTLAEAFEQSSSTFTVTAQRADRELNCSLTDPASGKTSNASVLLNVQFKPEIMTMNAKYREAKDPGLFMVLFVLVRANPPASITWIDQDGHVMVNTSDFLIVDTQSYPWLTNHTVQVQLSSVAKNFSFTAANNVGITNSSILPPGLLDTRVELPLLAIIVGGALALGTLLCLNTLIICLVCRKGKKASGERDVSLQCRCPGHQGFSLGLGVLPPPTAWVTGPGAPATASSV
ncbi:Transmembrane protein 25 [Platysternon megacephalum]|uniref:Transmembrane protein 25 n=1 Tax=Platysternon megacephalum TaxID=55544 RepID=A0A4D9E4D0_9SAUR|nr:Transmembrane protein 25 [Platysternon megacephalum]